MSELLDRITSDGIAAALGGIGTIIAALAGWTLNKARKEPAPKMTIDQLLIANTQAQTAVYAQFQDNNRLFQRVVELLSQIERASHDQKAVLDKIHDETIRGGGK